MLKHIHKKQNRRAVLCSLTKQRLKIDITTPNKCTGKMNIGEEKELLRLKAKISKRAL